MWVESTPMEQNPHNAWTAILNAYTSSIPGNGSRSPQPVDPRPVPFRKVLEGSTGSILRLMPPRGSGPSRFWKKGYTHYYIFEGTHVPCRADQDRLFRWSIGFACPISQENYNSPTRSNAILSICRGFAARSGEAYRVLEPGSAALKTGHDWKYLLLTRRYYLPEGERVDPARIGEDLAELVRSTLPAFQTLPEV